MIGTGSPYGWSQAGADRFVVDDPKPPVLMPLSEWVAWSEGLMSQGMTAVDWVTDPPPLPAPYTGVVFETGNVVGVGRLINPDLLVTATEIGERAGVNSQAVHNWASRHEDFPEPVKVFGTMRIWYLPDVESWLAAHAKV